MTEQEAFEFETLMKNRPHVVILGAGASVAAIPNGDANGKKISVMNDFFQKTNTEYLLEGIDLKTKSKNLEDIYSEIYEKPELKDVCIKLEKAIYDYFSDLQIPDEPTIYDFLILSLRKKDLIATFNWDPLLQQAYQRCGRITRDLPKIVFLHGNVAIGLCMQDKVYGSIDHYCPLCRQRLSPLQLLYPIKKKDYNSDKFIKDEWDIIEKALSFAFIITVFGYGAPPSDVEAIKLLKNAWGDTEKRQFEQTEIIDIKPEDKLADTWSPFIHSHHYEVHDSFFDSTIASFPRRTCECLYDQNLDAHFIDNEKGFKENMSWEDIEHYLEPILEDEYKNRDKNLTDFWIREL